MQSRKKQKVTLIVINSIIGRKGNIGLRYSYLLSSFLSENIEYFCIARGNQSKLPHIYYFPFLSYVQRGIIYLSKNYFLKLNGRKFDSFLFKIYAVILCLLFFIRYRKRSDIDVLLVEPSIFMMKIFKRLKCNVIVDIPIAPANYVKRLNTSSKNNVLIFNEYIDKVEKFTLLNADEIIVPSAFVESEIRALCPNANVHLIPFGVDLKLLEKNRSISREYNNEGLKFVFAGNLSKRKGVDLLIKAWVKVASPKDELHLCGNATREIVALLDDVSKSNIITPGFVDTFQYFQNCDVYIFPSLSEGSSKSVYEAMSCKLPCIVTYESGSIVTDGLEGLVIASNSISAIENAITNIRNSNLSAMGDNAFITVSKYSWKKYCQQVKELIYGR